jgi:hypothetical protein
VKEEGKGSYMGITYDRPVTAGNATTVDLDASGE